MSSPIPVSVLIPAYNAERYLTACLESIAAQSFADFEAIIINDGSTDGTAEIGRAFAARDPRFSVVDIPHSGLATARNRSIEASRGEFICFVDADDTLHPDALKILMYFQRLTGAEVVACDLTKGIRDPFSGQPSVNEDSALKPQIPEYRLSLLLPKLREMSPVEAIEQVLYQKILLNTACGKIISRNLLVNEPFTPGIYYEDLDAFYRFFDKADKIAYLPEPLYFYRQVPSSMIHSWNERRLDVLDVTDRILEYMLEHHPEITAAAEDRRFSAHFNMLAVLIVNDIDNPQAMERCMKVIRGYRSRELRNPRVRLKNKLGALLSYGGLPLIRLASRLSGQK